MPKFVKLVFIFLVILIIILFQVVICNSLLDALPNNQKPQSLEERRLEEQKNMIIIKGLDMLYSGNYKKAIAYFRKLDELDPKNAEGISLEAFALESILDDYRSEDPGLEKRLSSALEEAIKKGKEAVGKNPTARNYMFFAGAYGVRVVRQYKIGNWMVTFPDSIKFIRNIKKATKTDSNFLDSYYGMGLYNYWISLLMEKVPVIKLFHASKRELGIKQLHKARGGIFSPMPSRLALFRIYIKEEKYKYVITDAEKIFKIYPNSLVARWQYGLALIRAKQWKKAIKHYERILKLLEPIKVKGIEAQIEAWYYMGLSYYHLGERLKAKELLKKIVAYKGKVNHSLFFHENCYKKSKQLLDQINESLIRNKGFK